ncbi:Nn.00g049950.m01.CDS01 [Neocucurbitaria sp. VM-36]
MVQITASLLAILAAVSLTAAAPNALDARAPTCHDGGYLTNMQRDASMSLQRLVQSVRQTFREESYEGAEKRRSGRKNVAASAGLIMDACTVNHGVGDMVGGWAFVQGNGDFYIAIQGTGE